MTVKTRFAPSPTGYLHLGGARTALFSYLLARQQGGEFVLRIEDTDLERSTTESIEAIFAGMEWLGLSYDHQPIYQSRRTDRYLEIIKQLLASGNAYYCNCSRQQLDQVRQQQSAAKQKPRYNGKCRDLGLAAGDDTVVRFKNPQHGAVSFADLVKGVITIANQELDDLIIARSDGSPTYNLTVVVDDADSAITHVVRGDDHLSNTPRQINILQALGKPLPKYAHLPMILGADGSRLSKRHGAMSVLQYREDGYLPAAMLNYLARLGWSSGDKEIFSSEELLALFKLENVHANAAAFNPEKLLWLNQQYIIHSPAAAITPHLQWHFQQLGIENSGGAPLPALIQAQQNRCKTLQDMANSSRYFYQDFSQYDEKSVRKNWNASSDEILQLLLDKFTSLATWQTEELHNIVVNTADDLQLKMGKVALPLRVAICGIANSPPIDTTLFLLGRHKTCTRLTKAITFIKNNL